MQGQCCQHVLLPLLEWKQFPLHGPTPIALACATGGQPGGISVVNSNPVSVSNPIKVVNPNINSNFNRAGGFLGGGGGGLLPAIFGRRQR